jgi:hypothetical protein
MPKPLRRLLRSRRARRGSTARFMVALRPAVAVPVAA